MPADLSVSNIQVVCPGLRQPDVRAFLPVLRRVPSPASVLFLDDRCRNVETARRLGLRAVRVAAADPSWVTAVDRVAGAYTLKTIAAAVSPAAQPAKST